MTEPTLEIYGVRKNLSKTAIIKPLLESSPPRTVTRHTLKTHPEQDRIS